MKKIIPILLALTVGVMMSGCSGEEPIEKAPPVSSNDKNNFEVTTDKGMGVTEDGAAGGKTASQEGAG